MAFSSVGKALLRTYAVFEPYPEIVAVTGTKKADESPGPGDSGCTNGKDWSPPSWLRLLRIHPDRVARIQQVHGNFIVPVTMPGFYSNADALITDRKDIYLRIVTADCLPVFLYDPGADAAGLVHAGWRGLVQNIAGDTVRLMQEMYGSDPNTMRCAVGPYIHPKYYEVDEPVASRFPANCLESTGNGRYLLDLGAAVLSQLEEAGVASDRCELAGECTFAEDTLFHSYRRDGEWAGRNVSIFGLHGQPDSRQ